MEMGSIEEDFQEKKLDTRSRLNLFIKDQGVGCVIHRSWPKHPKKVWLEIRRYCELSKYNYTRHNLCMQEVYKFK